MNKTSLMYHYLFRAAESNNPYACLFFADKYLKKDDIIYMDKNKYKIIKNFAINAEKLLRKSKDENYQRSLMVLIKINMNEGNYNNVLILRKKLSNKNIKVIFENDKKILGEYFPFFTLIK